MADAYDTMMTPQIEGLLEIVRQRSVVFDIITNPVSVSVALGS